MFNSGIRGRRAKDGEGTVSTQSGFVQKSDPQPTITGYTISGIDDTALDPAGGQTIIVTGSGFATGISGTIGGTQLGAVTFVNSNQVTFTSPAKSAGSHALVLYNSTGGAAILVPGITYSSVPTYTTAAGSIGTIYETKSINISVVATSDSALTYSLDSGTLPAGATLSSNGTITGTAPTDASSTTYTFAIKATDTELQDVTRTFTLTINTDVVTWSTPSSGATIAIDDNPYSQTLSATSAAGYNVSYSANTLPTGLTLTSGTITGTPTEEGNVSTLLTATASTTNKSATNTITWVVSLSDPYWKSTSLLLNGSTPTTTFINDASLNNAQLTIAGDTKPNLFNPYTDGYYSNYFDGTGDYLTISASSSLMLGSGDFTVEAWVYTTLANQTYGSGIIGTYDGGSNGGWSLFVNRSSGATYGIGFIHANAIQQSYTTAYLAMNTWYHIAVTRSGTTLRTFLNGVQVASGTYSTADTVSATCYVGSQGVGQYHNGYISNARMVKGTALYTSNFTTPTSPLTAVANTQLLTCQSNRLIDNSPNNFAITKNGDTAVSSAYPFSTPTLAAYNTMYSVSFTGATADAVTIASAGAPLNLDADFTVEFWIFKTAYSSNNYTQYLNTGSNSQALKSTNTGPIYFYNGTSYSYTGAIVPLNVWTHVAWVRSGSTSRVYVNGTSGSSLTTFTSTVTWGTGTFRIGSDGGGGLGETLIGSMSNVRVIKGTAIYDVTQTTITVPTGLLTSVSGTSLLTCQNSTLKDNSTNNFTVASSGSASPIAISPFNMTTSSTTVTSLGSAYFPATSAYTTYSPANSDAFGTGDFTVECWFNPASTASVNISMASTTTSTWELLVYLNQLYWHENGGNLGGTGYGSIPLNAWSHLAVSRSGTALRMFINGIQVYSVTNSYNYSASPATRSIGPYNGGSAPAYISNFRVIKGTALYTSNFLPPQAPLTSVTNTQLLTLQYNGGANNNGFVDQSTFNYNITRTGNPTQGTFSPFSQTGWSTYFSATGNSLSGSHSLLNVSSQNTLFTFECWVYPITSGYFTGIGSGGAYGNSFAVDWGLGAANKFRVFGGNGSSNPVSFTSTNTFTANSWYHIAVTNEAGGVKKLYVNGVLEGTQTYNGTLATGTTFVVNGVYDNNGLGNNGGSSYVSNLRWVIGSIVYASAFTPPTTPLQTITGTVVLVCNANRFIDSSSNNLTVTVTGTPSVQAYSPFGSVRSVPISYSNYFDGTGDYLSTSNNTAFNFGTGDFTLELWANHSSVGQIQSMVSNYTGAANGWGFQWRSDTARLDFFMGDTQLIYYSFTPTVGTWYHYAVTRSGTSMKMFINGAVVATVTDSTNLTSTGPTYIGMINGTYGQYTYGYLSNVRLVKGTALYTSAFTPSTTPLTTTSQGATANQVSLLTCQSTTLIDNSTNYFTLTANGDVKPLPFNPFGSTTDKKSYSSSTNGGSMYFSNAAANYLTVTDSTLWNIGSTTPFTVEAWVYPIGITGSSIISSMFANSKVPYALGIGNAVGVVATSNQVWFGHYNSGWAGVVSPGSLTMNQWTHVAGVYTGTTIYLFVNGVMVTSSVSSWVAYDGATTAGYIAKRWDGVGGGADGFNGYITDARITKGAALYTSNFYPSTSPATPTTTLGTSTYPSNLLVNGTSSGIIDYHGSTNLETVGNTQLASEDPYNGSYYSVTADANAVNLTYSGTTFGTGAFTVEMWVYIPAVAATFVKYLIYSAATGAFRLQINSGTTIRMFSVGLTTQAFTVPQWQYDTWYHIAYTRDASGNATVFVNGTRSSTGSISDTNNYSVATTQIGGGTNTILSNVRFVTGTTVYDPTLSTITVPTSPLTAVNGTQLLTCQSNRFKDNSSNNYTIDATSVVTHYVRTFNPFRQNTGKSLYFDGSGDYLVTPYVANFSTQWLSDGTIECWVYFNSVANAPHVWSLSEDGSHRTTFYLSGAVFKFFVSVAGGSDIIVSTTTIAAGQWYHTAITRSGTTWTMWLNGVSQGTSTSTSRPYGPNEMLCLGWQNYSGAAGDYLNGYIKDLRITKGLARYTTTFTPPTIPLKNK